MKVFLITRKQYNNYNHYSDAFDILGSFSTEEQARKYVTRYKKIDNHFKDVDDYIREYSITEMTLNIPFNSEEIDDYPSYWYLKDNDFKK